MKNFICFISIALLPLVSCNKSSDDQSPDKKEESIKISGSDSEKALIRLMAKRFNPDAKILIEGGGSGIGIKQLIRGEVHVANSSREMSQAEVDSARSNGIEPFSVIIAMDALAIITSEKVGVDSLSTIQIKQILSGEIQNWKDLGGKDLPITIYGRDHHSGTHKYVKDLFLGSADFPSNTKIAKTNQEIIEKVKGDSSAVGYVGVAFVKNEFNKIRKGIRAVNVYIEGEDRAYSPLEDQKVMDGSYPFVRPLFQFFNGIPEGSLKSFVEFELSPQGQEIVFQYGYFPVPPELNENTTLAGN